MQGHPRPKSANVIVIPHIGGANRRIAGRGIDCGCRMHVLGVPWRNSSIGGQPGGPNPGDAGRQGRRRDRCSCARSCTGCVWGRVHRNRSKPHKADARHQPALQSPPATPPWRRARPRSAVSARRPGHPRHPPRGSDGRWMSRSLCVFLGMAQSFLLLKDEISVLLSEMYCARYGKGAIAA